jgi:hypothetical protein
MAKTAEQAMAKYARKTQNAAGKWKANTQGATEAWARGLADAGFTVGPETRSAYQAGVGAAEYRPGNPQKWLENTRRGLAR